MLDKSLLLLSIIIETMVTMMKGCIYLILQTPYSINKIKSLGVASCIVLWYKEAPASAAATVLCFLYAK